ncbi:hypothetical protein [Psychrobacter sp. TWP2-1-2]|uniref:hypothetical protein n=1 Tax=Psychrobacter sp. TWP2-1-2 TaxID=2804623 RepID=UPI003CFB6398
MENYITCTFSSSHLELDNKKFERCSFKQCVLTYGGGPLIFEDNSMKDTEIKFVGAAANTLAFISHISQAQGPGFLEEILSKFDQQSE